MAIITWSLQPGLFVIPSSMGLVWTLCKSGVVDSGDNVYAHVSILYPCYKYVNRVSIKGNKKITCCHHICTNLKNGNLYCKDCHKTSLELK